MVHLKFSISEELLYNQLAEVSTRKANRLEKLRVNDLGRIAI